MRGSVGVDGVLEDQIEGVISVLVYLHARSQVPCPYLHLEDAVSIREHNT